MALDVTLCVTALMEAHAMQLQGNVCVHLVSVATDVKMDARQVRGE